MKKAIICFVTIFACLILTVGCNTYNAKLIMQIIGLTMILLRTT